MLSSSDSISDGRLLQRAWSPVVTVFDLQVQSDGRRGPETSITSRMPQRISSRRSSSQVRSLLKYHGPPPPPSSLTREAAKEEKKKSDFQSSHLHEHFPSDDQSPRPFGASPFSPPTRFSVVERENSNFFFPHLPPQSLTVGPLTNISESHLLGTCG